MKKHQIIKFFGTVLLFVSNFLQAQNSSFLFQRSLTGVVDKWHNITIPNDVFGKLQNGLNDIRIIGVTAAKDSFEVPYILQIANEKQLQNRTPCKIFNTATTKEGFSFELEMPTTNYVKEIALDINENDFDWLVKVEGSNNQHDWVTISEACRITAFKNDKTQFTYTNLQFPESKYTYFRCLIPTKDKPALRAASVVNTAVIKPIYINYEIESFRVNQHKASKQTFIELTLEKPVPISFIQLNIPDNFDFYRPITVKCLTDSVKTVNGWEYIYETVANSMLHSSYNKSVSFDEVIGKRFSIVIENEDNIPLNIISVQAKGYEHVLTARFDKKANYFLMYSNKTAGKPNYDLLNFANKIPANLTSLQIGEEKMIDAKAPMPVTALFENKLWLWLILVLTIVVIGWFSISMLKKN